MFLFYFTEDLCVTTFEEDSSAEAGSYLANAAGPVPDKIIPVPVVVMALVHDLSHQIVHSHAEHRQRTQLVGQRLLLVG